MITSLLLIAVLDGAFFGGPFTQGHLPERINEASGMVASSSVPVLWTVNDSGGEPTIYGVESNGTVRYELRLIGAANVDWEDIAYNPKTHTIYVGDIGDNAGKRPNIRLYAVKEPVLGVDSIVAVRPTVRDLVYPDGARDAETLLCDPSTGTLYIVSKRERRNRLYQVPDQGDTLRFVTELPFYLATGGDVSADGGEILVKNYTHVFHWTRAEDESMADAMRRSPTRIHYMPETQGECLAFAHNGSGYYTVTEREDGGPPAPIEFYPRVSSQADVDRVRDVRRPSLMLNAIDGAADMYEVRYAVTEETNIELFVRNAIGMVVKTIEDNSREAGAQDRELDMSGQPEGTYVLVLRTRTTYASVPFEITR